MKLIAHFVIVAIALSLAACGHSNGGPSPYASSPQRHDGVFANAPNPDALPTASAWKNWSRFLFGDKVGTVPIDPIPLVPLTTAQLEALDAQANHVVRLGHSSHLLKLKGKYWLIDPVFGERASPFSFAGPKRFHRTPIALDQLPPIEGLVLSHDHYDHLDSGTIEYLALRVQRYFVPLGVKARLIDFGVPADRIVELDWWRGGAQGDVKVTAAPAQHFSGRSLTDRDRTLWASWIIESGDQRIFYSGDSGYFSGFKQIGERFGGFDLALIENGAYDAGWPVVHMTPEQSLMAVKDVRAKLLYPVHNSTFDLAFHPWQEPMERVAKLASDQGVALATPLIGEVLTIGASRTNKLWWQGLR
ncbi:MBL fold metallo-hydrolase [soil metagenome]